MWGDSCGFDLQFSDAEWCWTPFHGSVGLCLLWKKKIGQFSMGAGSFRARENFRGKPSKPFNCWMELGHSKIWADQGHRLSSFSSRRELLLEFWFLCFWKTSIWIASGEFHRAVVGWYPHTSASKAELCTHGTWPLPRDHGQPRLPGVTSTISMVSFLCHWPGRKNGEHTHQFGGCCWVRQGTWHLGRKMQNVVTWMS